MTNELFDTIAAASAEYGMQQIANWIPASRHEELRELLYDLVIGAIAAHQDSKTNWGEAPHPSDN